MSFDPFSALVDLATTTIKKIWPDPVKQAEELRKLEELRQKGDLAQLDAHVKLMIGQLNVNAAEATHKSIFVAGWRPGIGWVGAVAMAYQFIAYPLLVWVWAILQVKEVVPMNMAHPPMLDTGALFAIITAMLGIGAMRSVDKRNKVQTDRIS